MSKTKWVWDDVPPIPRTRTSVETIQITATRTDDNDLFSQIKACSQIYRNRRMSARPAPEWNQYFKDINITISSEESTDSMEMQSTSKAIQRMTTSTPQTKPKPLKPTNGKKSFIPQYMERTVLECSPYASPFTPKTVVKKKRNNRTYNTTVFDENSIHRSFRSTTTQTNDSIRQINDICHQTFNKSSKSAEQNLIQTDLPNLDGVESKEEEPEQLQIQEDSQESQSEEHSEASGMGESEDSEIESEAEEPEIQTDLPNLDEVGSEEEESEELQTQEESEESQNEELSDASEMGESEEPQIESEAEEQEIQTDLPNLDDVESEEEESEELQIQEESEESQSEELSDASEMGESEEPQIESEAEEPEIQTDLPNSDEVGSEEEESEELQTQEESEESQNEDHSEASEMGESEEPQMESVAEEPEIVNDSPNIDDVENEEKESEVLQTQEESEKSQNKEHSKALEIGESEEYQIESVAEEHEIPTDLPNLDDVEKKEEESKVPQIQEESEESQDEGHSEASAMPESEESQMESVAEEPEIVNDSPNLNDVENEEEEPEDQSQEQMEAECDVQNEEPLADNEPQQLRRSQRKRIKPLEFWRGERPIYKRDSTGICEKIVAINEGTQDVVRQRKRTTVKRKLEMSSKKNVNIFDLSIHQKKLKIRENNDILNIKSMESLVWKSSNQSTGVDIAIVKKNKQKGDAVGHLRIQGFGQKKSSKTGDYSTYLNVMFGVLALKVEDSDEVLFKTGQTFCVGPATNYSLVNLRKDVAYVSFTVLKE